MIRTIAATAILAFALTGNAQPDAESNWQRDMLREAHNHTRLLERIERHNREMARDLDRFLRSQR